MIDLHAIVQKNRKEARRHLRDEIRVLEGCKHRNIIQLLGHHHVTGSNKFYLFFPFCCGGNLKQFLKNRGTLKPATARNFCRQIAEGLTYLFSRKIIHRDLKPKNILMSNSSSKATLQITGFAVSRYKKVVKGQTVHSTNVGTPAFMALEILEDPKKLRYGSNADLW